MTKATLRLTARDEALLVDIYKHRYLTIGQIHRLHFPSLQTAYRRTRLLKSSGHLLAFNVPNVSDGIYGLTSHGLDVVAGATGVERADLKWNEASRKPKDYYFMRHFISINDFRIAVRQACDKSSINLLGFIPDYYGERSPSGAVAKYVRDVICDLAPGRETISHTPDGVFALEKDGKSALFFLEIDRGTEVISDPEKGVLKSLRFYANYLLEGKYQRYTKDFGVAGFKGFRTLFVTTTTDRLDSIRRAASELPTHDKARRFLWITTEEKVTNRSIFTPIWKSMDLGDETIYRLG
jgi:hypothetical protein